MAQTIPPQAQGRWLVVELHEPRPIVEEEHPHPQLSKMARWLNDALAESSLTTSYVQLNRQRAPSRDHALDHAGIRWSGPHHVVEIILCPLLKQVRLRAGRPGSPMFASLRAVFLNRSGKKIKSFASKSLEGETRVTVGCIELEELLRQGATYLVLEAYPASRSAAAGAGRSAQPQEAAITVSVQAATYVVEDKDNSDGHSASSGRLPVQDVIWGKLGLNVMRP